MRNNRSNHTIQKMANTLEVSRSGYYRWLNAKESKRVEEDKILKPKVVEIFKEHKGRYGSPRIVDDLKDEGLKVSRRRVSRLMKEENLVSKAQRRKKKTTNSKHSKNIAPHVLKDVEVVKPNQAYVSDITYIKTMEGWLYLVIILDLFTRKIVSWATSSNMKTELISRALWKAIKKEGRTNKIIFHSDRGSQYASNAFKSLLEQNKFIPSMGAKGYCYDNAYAESFFHTLKTELTEDEHYLTREQAHASIFEYIEIDYNFKRKHSGLNYKSPINYEKEFKRLNCA